jgi:TrmH family RNA methyltransferase
VGIQASHLTKSQFKYFRELLHKKYRQERQEFLVEGVRLCSELLNSEIRVKAVVFTDRLLRHADSMELVEKVRCKNIPVYETEEETLQRLTSTCTPQPIVACACGQIQTLDKHFWEGNRFVVLLHVNDPGNVGTLLRTAEAFYWNSVICVGETVELYNPKVVRSSMGSLFRLKVACSTLDTLMSFFEYMAIPYFITMPGAGMSPENISLPPKLALFLGNEARGLPPSLADKACGILQIPMSSKVESLNVAVAGGILLFLLRYDLTASIHSANT